MNDPDFEELVEIIEPVGILLTVEADETGEIDYIMYETGSEQ